MLAGVVEQKEREPSMKGIVSFTEHFFWAVLWVFLLIIVGLAVLHWIQNWNVGGPLGNAASWVTGAVTP